MIILEKPYVSDFLIETIKKNNFKVLKNQISKTFFEDNYLNGCVIENSCASDELFYSNSENSIDCILSNYAACDVAKYIKISKNKILFRDMLKKVYPDFYFKKISIKDIDLLNSKEFKYPLILKPSVGFLSFGVYPIYNSEDWSQISKKLKNDIKNLEGIFPHNVVDFDEFIIEEMIEGDEYAIDAYFDENGRAVILNIFKHPFFDENDVSDRLYYTSADIIEKNLKKFQNTLDKIGECIGYRNFPFHLELRVNENNIIPIEINPLRFCGWCITDIAKFAWGINVYEYYFKKLKPNWSKILSEVDNSYYYFTIADVPSDISNKNIKYVDYEKYLTNITNPLEIRKINPVENPVFTIVFAKTNDEREMKNHLKLNMKDFIVC